VKRAAVAAACVGVGTVALGLTFFRASDEERIRRVLDELAAIVEVKADDNLLVRVGRLRSRMKDVVTDDVHVDVPELRVKVSSRSDLENEGARAGLLFPAASCTFGSSRIRIDPMKTQAAVDTVASCTVGRRSDRRDVHVLLRNDGGWRITSLDVAAGRGTADLR